MIKRNAWHMRAIKETFDALDSGPNGLEEGEAHRRLEAHGPNEIRSEKRAGRLSILLNQVKSPLVGVLAAAALIALLGGKTVDFVVILAIIVINSLIGFFQEYRAEEAIHALRSRIEPEVEVVRHTSDGEVNEMRIKAAKVVPGDVILLDAGRKVPADARIFHARNLEIDESMLTGESLPVEKRSEPLDRQDLPAAEWANIAFAGTSVIGGRGTAVVFATGSGTRLGQIAAQIEGTEKKESPLHRQMRVLGQYLGLLALVMAGAVLLLGLLRGDSLGDLFPFVLAGAVSSIPEGLPAVLSITLAVGVNRMARRHAIIRQLPAVDTLGAVTTICTDKTGTLTSNQMTVREMRVGGDTIHVTGVGFVPEGHFEARGERLDIREGTVLYKALQTAALCNDSRLVREGERWDVRGDPTEGALLVAARKAGVERENVIRDLPRVEEIPFSSDHKYMVTFHETDGGAIKVCAKGAPEALLPLCAYRLVDDGGAHPLSERDEERILGEGTEMAGGSLRVLAVAQGFIEPENVETFKRDLREGKKCLAFLGLMGMIDPPRSEVKDAIRLCRQAGIGVIMITGDHRVTAEAIAREVGILHDGDGVLSGADLSKMEEDDLDAVVLDTKVFARVSPSHKQRIVRSLQRKGHVVAMTGDGVNDAPALKRSEIGVAMGVMGTDVARETSDMVLTDDNFASIVNAVEEGRVVFQNIRKVVKFLIATNLGEDITILLSMLLLASNKLIFTPVQILWVNLVTDGLLDIAIAMEPKESDVMHAPPRDPREPILNGEILRNILLVAPIMAVGTLLVFFRAYEDGNHMLRARTLSFVTMAMFQVFNALNVRSRRQSIFEIGLFTNRYVIGAMALSIFLLILATTVPFLQMALGTVALTPGDWLLIVAVSSTILFADELRKAYQKHTSKRSAPSPKEGRTAGV
jgi:Ca2+-transporting ATPase